MNHLHVWAVVRLLPNMQRAVLNRFRRRGDAENYVYVLRRYLPDAKIEIIFDPPSKEVKNSAHLNREKILENRLLSPEIITDI